jgi:hypothetical protein
VLAAGAAAQSAAVAAASELLLLLVLLLAGRLLSCCEWWCVRSARTVVMQLLQVKRESKCDSSIVKVQQAGAVRQCQSACSCV